MFGWNRDGGAGIEGLPLAQRMVLAAVAIGLFLGWRHCNPPSVAMAGWSVDWGSAATQSRQSGKPTLVLFTADWCPSCRLFEGDVLSRDDVKSYLATHCTPVIVDLSDRGGAGCRTAMEYNVRGIPTVILYDRNGQELGRRNGMSADALMAWIDNKGRN